MSRIRTDFRAEVLMPTILRITSDSTKPEIAEAITHLRRKQQQAALETTRAEVQVTIDALLDVWPNADD